MCSQELDAIEAELDAIEAALPPPPPTLYILTSGTSTPLPLFCTDHNLLSFQDKGLRETFFQFHPQEEDDEDRSTPREEAELAERSNLATADAAWKALSKLRQRAKVPSTLPGAGRLRFTMDV